MQGAPKATVLFAEEGLSLAALWYKSSHEQTAGVGLAVREMRIRVPFGRTSGAMSSM